MYILQCSHIWLDGPDGRQEGRAGAMEAAGVQVEQMRAQKSWDQYVAHQLLAAKSGEGQAKLVSALESRLAQPGEWPLCALAVCRM